MGSSMFETGDQDYGSMVGWDPHKERLNKLIAEAKKNNPRVFSPVPDMLFVRPANGVQEIAGKWEPMQQLFGPLWLREEVAVLYSSPGVGKSSLAVQIGESLARGISIAPFDKPRPGCEVPPQRVLYIDFELTLQQFTRRYSTESDDGLRVENLYEFSPNFFRGELVWNGRIDDGYEDFTDMLFTDLDRKLTEHEATVLICDNITFLSTSSTANASIAFRLMSRLQELKKYRFISILAVAHTPKRLEHRPLTERDLQGSIDLAKVADSMFALGRSCIAPDLRYIKQIKSRSGQMEFGSENVLVYHLGKFDLSADLSETNAASRNFFGYSFVGLENELIHLPAPFRPLPVKQRPKVDRRVAYAKMLAEQGMSSAAIGKKLGIGKTTAYRYVMRGGKNARSTIEA